MFRNKLQQTNMLNNNNQLLAPFGVQIYADFIPTLSTLILSRWPVFQYNKAMLLCSNAERTCIKID